MIVFGLLNVIWFQRFGWRVTTMWRAICTPDREGARFEAAVAGFCWSRPVGVCRRHSGASSPADSSRFEGTGKPDVRKPRGQRARIAVYRRGRPLVAGRVTSSPADARPNVSGQARASVIRVIHLLGDRSAVADAGAR